MGEISASGMRLFGATRALLTTLKGLKIVGCPVKFLALRDRRHLEAAIRAAPLSEPFVIEKENVRFAPG